MLRKQLSSNFTCAQGNCSCSPITKIQEGNRSSRRSMCRECRQLTFSFGLIIFPAPDISKEPQWDFFQEGKDFCNSDTGKKKRHSFLKVFPHPLNIQKKKSSSYLHHHHHPTFLCGSICHSSLLHPLWLQLRLLQRPGGCTEISATWTHWSKGLFHFEAHQNIFLLFLSLQEGSRDPESTNYLDTVPNPKRIWNVVTVLE